MSAAQLSLLMEEVKKLTSGDKILLYKHKSSDIWIQAKNNRLPFRRPKNFEYRFATLDNLPA